MKTVLGIVFFSALAGIGLGAALGYIEARLPSEVPAPDVSLAEAVPPTIRGPLAQSPETTFNFDRIERGTSMKHAFKIRNVGDAPLKVEVASTTCKCTVGDLERNEIPPGEETDVVLEWTAKTPPGPFRHGATLSTNDVTSPRIELVVEGEVVESTTLQPAELLFGTVSTHAEKSASTLLVSNLEEEVKVLHHEFSDSEVGKYLDLEITPVEKTQLPMPGALSGVRVTATYHPGKSLGPFFTWLTLETNLKKAEKLTVPIAGTVVGDISVFGPGWTPSQGVLRVGSVLGKEGKRVRLNIAVRGEHALGTRLEVASVDPPELQVSLGEPKEMGKQLLHVPLVLEIPAGTKPMIRIAKLAGEEDNTNKGDGVVVLKTTHPETDEVRLLVRFSVE
jgi:hypothetical protein